MDWRLCPIDITGVKKAALRQPAGIRVPHPALISGTRTGLALEGA